MIITLGFKVDNEWAIQFRKWANEIDRKTLSELINMIYVIDKNNIKIEFKNIWYNKLVYLILLRSDKMNNEEKSFSKTSINW